MLMRLPHFWLCLCNYYMETNTRYTCVTCNPCLCNSHISDRVCATTTWEPILDILVWLISHAYATPTFLCLCNYYMGTNTRYTCVTINPCLCNSHISVRVCVTTIWEPKIGILVWLVIHAYAIPTFLTVFLQLLHGNQYQIYLCD